jgi:SAM-dependent methyltransferase
MKSDHIAKEMQQTYDLYFSRDGYRRRYPRPNAATLDYLLLNGARDATHILDFGCGNGRYSLALLAQSDAALTAYDISAASLGEFHRNLMGTSFAGRVVLIHDDLSALGEPASYDLVIMLFGVLSHVGPRSARVEALAQLRRLIRTDGRLIISVPSVYRRRPWELFKAAVARRLGQARPPLDEAGNISFTRHVEGQALTFFYHLYRLGELRAELAEAGFRLLECEAESVLPEWCVTQWPIACRADQWLAARISPALGYGMRILAVPV